METTADLHLRREFVRIAEREREALAREIHDALGQPFTLLMLDVHSLEQNLKEKGIPLPDEVSRVKTSLEDMAGQVRKLIRGLRPMNFPPRLLPSAIQALLDDAGKRSGIIGTVRADPRVVIHDSDAAYHLFRIAQEAMNNALRHGLARQIGFRLFRSRTGIVFEIRSDGRSFAPPESGRDGLGLLTMRTRCELLGGEFQILAGEGTDPGAGTVVTCRLPPRRRHTAREGVS